MTAADARPRARHPRSIAMRHNQQILLAARPLGHLDEGHFRLAEGPVPALAAGQFLMENKYLALDAGFRQWMNAGASDNYLSAMPLDAPVQSIVLGVVVESRHPDYREGDLLMGRTAWERYSIADGSDLMTRIEPAADIPLHEYLCALGPAGMTAYFGLLDIGQPRAGDEVLVSAAAGGVGAIVGQIAKIKGCRAVGITGGEDKCAWIREQLGYDAAINHRAPAGVAAQIEALLPNGIDIFFDNVGGAMLDTAMAHLAERARIVLCGAISQYDTTGEHTGVHHMWELITKRARAEGFMFSDYVDRYPAAMEEMAGWIRAGKLKSPVAITTGIEHTARAYCDMLDGRSLGKCLVKLD
ncbi:MAG: NADP-dependent oxidoreductase [Pseudomonadota bacterium]|nr:NADP-dependent oxidoreductase [Pseudomonadota bacterium]